MNEKAIKTELTESFIKTLYYSTALGSHLSLIKAISNKKDILDIDENQEPVPLSFVLAIKITVSFMFCKFIATFLEKCWNNIQYFL